MEIKVRVFNKEELNRSPSGARKTQEIKLVVFNKRELGFRVEPQEKHSTRGCGSHSAPSETAYVGDRERECV